MNEQQQADSQKERRVKADRNSFEVLTPIEGRSLPENFKIGRSFLIESANYERDLFAAIEEKNLSNGVTVNITDSDISELDLSQFAFAMGQILYNQSYLSGNERTNSGLTAKEYNAGSRLLGFKAYRGDVSVSVRDICRLAYGVDEPRRGDRECITALIDKLHNTAVEVKYPNGKRVKSFLCTKEGEMYKNDTDGAYMYDLHLCPLFCVGLVNNFAEFPQDTTKRMTLALNERNQRNTLAHTRLLRLLGLQDKRKPFIISIEALLNKLDLMKLYKKNKKVALKSLSNKIQIMADIGLISGLPVEGVGADGVTNYTFTLSQDFVKRLAQPEQAALQHKKKGRPKKDN